MGEIERNYENQSQRGEETTIQRGVRKKPKGDEEEGS